ncbi:NAD(P)/FAD-dependent oxidoreductase [Halobellus rufus]|uniref:NAD(P)/FAD-dependent oxidoreductase n=1 Tax=Halobellus rufus TaxID=1448860 RepID=UPI000679164B|nr:FAD-dependent oxidoreductase [Halobellus rufus]
MAHDVIIIGTGPAGLAAGAYAGRSGLDTLFFEDESIGGELVNRHEIRSYPGFPDGVSGTELRSKMVEEAEKYDPDVNLERVQRIEPGDPHAVLTESGAYEATAVIVATGSSDGHLGVPGEEEYAGRGVFYCATCDGPLYREERIAVVGGGNHAVIDAVFLTEYASEVLLIDGESELAADETLVEEAREHDDVEILNGATVAEVLGADGLVTGVRVERGGGEETIELGGVNVNVGSRPNSSFLDDTVALDDEGHVAVDHRMETDVAGVFAAGDVRQGSPLEIAAAVGDGVTAIEAAKRHVAER